MKTQRVISFLRCWRIACRKWKVDRSRHGDVVAFNGMSTRGITGFRNNVNSDAFRTLRDDWNTNCIRLAMYTAEKWRILSGGDKETFEQNSLLGMGVSYATDLRNAM